MRLGNGLRSQCATHSTVGQARQKMNDNKVLGVVAST
jgi:hypothetical protein